ncbi:hypothetical protein NBRC3280_3356 [Acetobacter pasteurianus NBRC 3280]|uniref:hypothetical protein n=1 Tax=Acetobacter pasteurianus TaxID=438 RepID=UPI000FF982B6|nr:hypothetical protein [Acetobacter pasteurianus]GCD70721.1 hypothetical protein NBRC3280_3356 [Acetobacter pasteurianus NBRC 3280]
MDNNLLKKIRDKALSDFPNDYETALFQIENQIQAINDINNFKDDEVPNNILLDIQKKALSDFDDDFDADFFCDGVDGSQRHRDVPR